MSDPLMLSIEEVLKVHETLVDEFARTNDPISPPGIKSLPLLESAVGRQLTSMSGILKYPDPVANAATLLFGICCDHPFHNGNKRTALVCMLVHLDKNHLCLFETGQRDLYKLLLAVADHSIGLRRDPRKHDKLEHRRRNSDEEVAAITHWLKDRVDKVRRGERQITYRELRRIIARFGFELEVVKRNSADVIKTEIEPPTLLRRSPRTVKKRIGNIGYKDEGTFLAIKEIKLLRRICRMTEEDGVDHDAFYNEDTVIDTYVNHYRTLLRRLARV